MVYYPFRIKLLFYQCNLAFKHGHVKWLSSRSDQHFISFSRHTAEEAIRRSTKKAFETARYAHILTKLNENRLQKAFPHSFYDRFFLFALSESLAIARWYHIFGFSFDFLCFAVIRIMLPYWWWPEVFWRFLIVYLPQTQTQTLTIEPRQWHCQKRHSKQSAGDKVHKVTENEDDTICKFNMLLTVTRWWPEKGIRFL